MQGRIVKKLEGVKIFSACRNYKSTSGGCLSKSPEKIKK